jgi:ketosteroid isomerase-like protein
VSEENMQLVKEATDAYVDDNRVLVLGYQRGRIKGSDQKLQHEIAFAGEIREDKVARVRIYLSWEEGLKAVGLEQ